MNRPTTVADDGLQQGFLLADRRVDTGRSQVQRPDAAVHVEPRAMAVLLALARQAGQTVHRDAVIAEVWGHLHVSDEALSRCISLLRRSLGDDRAQPRFIETIAKQGHRLMVAPALPSVSAQPVSVVVLPFINVSGSPAEEHITSARC